MNKSLTAAFVAVALIIVAMAVAPSAQVQDKVTVPSGGDPIWPKVRQALQGTGVPFVLHGEGMGINGHGAARTPQFNVWFGKCLQDFLDPARSPGVGETKCPPPAVTP